MSGIIFINYRRDDSRWPATSLRDLLARELPRERVFMDVDDIPLGVDFVEYLGGQVGKCQIMVSLIGPQWLEMLRRRAGDPRDFVRIEIEAALTRNIRVIPVLIDGTAMPGADELPESLKPLARRNAAQLRHESFGADGGKLARALREAVGGRDPASRVRPGSGESFTDFTGGPEMVVVPAGEFMMGTAAGETAALIKEHGDAAAEYFRRENPQHKVVIPRAYAAGKFAVTRGEFSAFVNETGHKVPDEAITYEGGKWETRKGRSFRTPGFAQDDNHPVVCVSWDDAQAYVKWLEAKTGKGYRLLSEAEWEYAARAGTVTPFWWGSPISTDQANYDGNFTFGGGNKGEYREKTVPVNSFNPNPWGLYQVHGNVWEWCEDCWNENYNGAPADGSAWTTGNCSLRVLRGGAWYFDPRILRSAARYRCHPVYRDFYAGFRVARTLNP